ncbi:MAG: isochorismatase family cysteine hydrolase [Nanoarchaeota archaeon]
MTTALLLIDMQNDFVLEDASFAVKGAKSIIQNTKKILATFRKHDLPIFHIVRAHKADGSDVEITRREKFKKTPYTVENTDGAEIIHELRPKEDEYIIIKKRMSGFINTDLEKRLRSSGVDKVVITGVQTPNCIRATAFDAIAYDYETYLVEDAVAANTQEIHDANILDMKNIGIKMIKTKDVEEMLK